MSAAHPHRGALELVEVALGSAVARASRTSKPRRADDAVVSGATLREAARGARMSARRIVLCLPCNTPFFDPMPEETAKRDVELSAEWDGTPAGVVGWAEGGWAALTLAAEHKQLVDRLVLVSAPAPGTEPKTIELDSIQAKTLLLFGMRNEVVKPRRSELVARQAQRPVRDGAERGARHPRAKVAAHPLSPRTAHTPQVTTSSASSRSPGAGRFRPSGTAAADRMRGVRQRTDSR